jgi:16S rRNA (cytidine1402-2'-O)-methyltransferase
MQPNRCVRSAGAQLVHWCAQANITVHPIPGVSAVTAALSVAGTYAQEYGPEFKFFGFLPVKGAFTK